MHSAFLLLYIEIMRGCVDALRYGTTFVTKRHITLQVQMEIYQQYSRIIKKQISHRAEVNSHSTAVQIYSNFDYTNIIEHYVGHDYWTGGLNPGLLWIWSNSARPVVPKNSTQPEDTIGGTGRCLKLAYTGSNKIYAYSGADCSVRFRFICEHEENLTDRALKRIHKSLKTIK